MSFLREAAVSGAAVFLATAVLVVAVLFAFIVYSAACSPSEGAPAFLRTPTPAPISGGADVPRPAASVVQEGTPVRSTAERAPSVIPQESSTPIATPSALPRPLATPTTPPAASAGINPVRSFSGSWTAVDTVLDGQGAGQTFTFDVTLNQNGKSLTGGNGGITISGTVDGPKANLTFIQTSVGYQGTFTWTMTNGGNAEGTFSSSVPNSGRSELLPR